MTDNSRSPSRQQSGQPNESTDTDEGTRNLSLLRSCLPWVARVTGVGLSAISLGFVLVLFVVLENGGELMLITRPIPMQVVLALPYLIVLFTLGTTIGAVLAWWNRYWSQRIRIHQTVLAIFGLGFSWQLIRLGFLTL